MDKGCIIRNIVKEIVKECIILKGITVYENLVGYYTKLLILDPKWGLSADHMSGRNEVQQFIRFVVDKLSNQTAPTMIILKMQFYFSCNFDNRDELIRQNRRNLKARIAPIKHEILQITSVRSPEEISGLYKKIVYYITLASGLGNPTVISNNCLLKCLLYRSVANFTGCQQLSLSACLLTTDTFQRLETDERTVDFKHYFVIFDCHSALTNWQQLNSSRKSAELLNAYVYTSQLFAPDELERVVFREARTALVSVLFENELKDFCHVTQREKEELIEEYQQLVTGIRLFNKDLKRGGVGMGDLMPLMDCALENLISELQQTLYIIMERVNKLTTVVDNSYPLVELSEGKFYVRTKLPHNITPEDMRLIKDVLLLYRQYELYVRKLIGEVQNVNTDSHKMFDKFRRTMDKLHDIVQYRIAIPCVQVFPVFRELHDVWCKIQDQAMLIAKLDQIMVNLGLYVKQVKFNYALLDLILGDSGTMTDADRLVATSSDRILQEKLGEIIRVRQASTIKDMDKIKFQYLGFCGYKLVETDGGLIPGNPNLGVIKAENLNFVFSSKEAAECFAHRPERYIASVLEMARKRPELINFLQLQDQLTAVSDTLMLIEEGEQVYINLDVEVQTDTHIMPENIDTKYKWNIWDLKREALKLADLTKTRTVATQSMVSNTRTNIGLQTYENRDKELQTKIDNYTNVPKPSIYLFGLRGRTDDMQLIVDLTRPVEE